MPGEREGPCVLCGSAGPISKTTEIWACPYGKPRQSWPLCEACAASVNELMAPPRPPLNAADLLPPSEALLPDGRKETK